MSCWFTLTFWHHVGFQRRAHGEKSTFWMSLGHYLLLDSKALVQRGVKCCCLTASSLWTLICACHGEEKVSAWPLHKSHLYTSSIITVPSQSLGFPWQWCRGSTGWVVTWRLDELWTKSCLVPAWNTQKQDLYSAAEVLAPFKRMGVIVWEIKYYLYLYNNSVKQLEKLLTSTQSSLLNPVYSIKSTQSSIKGFVATKKWKKEKRQKCWLP